MKNLSSFLLPDPGQKTQEKFISSSAALVVLSVLGLCGCLCIWSSMGGNAAGAHFALRQLAALIFGIILYLFVIRIPFRTLLDTSFITGGICIGFLFLVLLTGQPVNGMHGWFRFGSFLSIQPSEFAKVFFLLYLSRCASEKEDDPKTYVKILIASCAFIAPVILEPDLGTGIVFFAGMLCILYCGNFSLRKILLPLFSLIVTSIAYVQFHPYAMERILGFLDPAADPGRAGWHIRQFRYTIARGGFFGAPADGISWSESYLPLAHSDSAFASIIESAGLSGGVIVIAGFLLLALIFRYMALESADRAGKIYIFSAGFTCVFQAFLHIGVNASVLPPTGLTLPVFSYGGSSLIATMLLFAIAGSAAGKR